MKRAEVLARIKGCGSAGDQAGFLRLYTENRVSFAAARQAYQDGQRLARFVQARDTGQASAAPATTNHPGA